jgi:hypothetical protein
MPTLTFPLPCWVMPIFGSLASSELCHLWDFRTVPEPRKFRAPSQCLRVSLGYYANSKIYYWSHANPDLPSTLQHYANSVGSSNPVKDHSCNRPVLVTSPMEVLDCSLVNVCSSIPVQVDACSSPVQVATCSSPVQVATCNSPGHVPNCSPVQVDTCSS